MLLSIYPAGLVFNSDTCRSLASNLELPGVSPLTYYDEQTILNFVFLESEKPEYTNTKHTDLHKGYKGKFISYCLG